MRSLIFPLNLKLWKIILVTHFLVERQFFESGEKGTISSPGYPSNYGIKKNFYWRIEVPQRKKVEISFDNFELEDSPNCVKDFLKVYNGRDAFHSLFGTYCGDTPPENLRSSRNYMYLHFQSDDDMTRKGFKVRWRAYEEVQPEGIFTF